ncbi:MAG: ArnT family glycosyltransferase [Nitrososphaerota archaeon]
MSVLRLARKSRDDAPRSARTSNRVELLATLALLCCYLATMSGHLFSIDGLEMYRQGYSLAFYHSVTIQPPFWWGTTYTASKYGIGISLLYVPFMLPFFWLRQTVPVFHDTSYHGQMLYADPLYTVAVAPVHAVVTAAAAYLVARTIRILGFGERAALWGLVLYGLGSPALVYARGDYAQPLSGLCWIAAIYCVLLFRQSGRQRWLVLSSLVLMYGVLTRAVDGSLALPAAMLLVVPDLRIRWWRWDTWRSLIILAAGWAVGVALTLLVNVLRFGSALNFGYGGESWTGSLPIGLAGSLISPARGLLWSFPAIILLVPGIQVLWRKQQKLAVVALVGLAVIELLNTALWWVWWGGWDWGLRLFVPALPVLAVVAGCGVSALGPRLRWWLPAVLLFLGFLWALPGVVTNLLAGYMVFADGSASFNWRTYPPIGGWQWLTHIRPPAGKIMDVHTVDIVWVRYSHVTGNASLVPAASLGLAAIIFVYGAFHVYRVQTRFWNESHQPEG